MQINADFEIDCWHGCYDDNWNGMITPESFCHPAKYSRGLIERIIKHVLEEGMIEHGGIVIDPFGGVSTGGIIAAYNNLQWIGCELEEKFCNLAKQNFDLHRNAWRKLGCPEPIILQGDSRKLSQVIEKAEIVISSPPYSETDLHFAKNGLKQFQPGYSQLCKKGNTDQYGSTSGQLGAMKAGNVDAQNISKSIIKNQKNKLVGNGTMHSKTSKPFVQNVISKATEINANIQYVQNVGKNINEKNLDNQNAYALSVNDKHLMKHQSDIITKQQKYISAKFVELNLNLPMGDGNIAQNNVQKKPEQLNQIENITNEPDDFWTASYKIVTECHKILKDGGYAIWVVKDFVRAKKRVDFCGDWRRLCEACGFETVHEHHAMLVKETKLNTLFEVEVTKFTERKSFFRRLAEKKGSPKIDYETVLCMRKTND